MEASLLEGEPGYEEMLERDQQTNERVKSRRGRLVRRFLPILSLSLACCYVLLFVLIVRTGYLSWLGILVGVVYVAPGVLSPFAGFAGRKRLEAFLSWLTIGAPILLALAVSLASIWPEGDSDGPWMPYTFDEELAAIEAGRAVANQDNAAYHYDSLFAEVDVNDQPDYLFTWNSPRDALGKQPWNSDDYPQASAWLDSHAGIVDRLLAIGGIEKCRWPVQADPFDEYTVPCRGLRYSARLLTTAGNRDLGEDRPSSAVTKYFCVLRTADHRRQQPSVVDSLSGLGFERNALHMLRHVLVRSDLSREDIARVANHLPPTADPWPQQWTTLLESGKLRYMNFLARAYETNSAGRVRFARRYRLSLRNEETREDRDFGRWLRLYWPMNMPRDPQHLRAMVDRHFVRCDLLGPNGMPPSGERMDGFWSEVPWIIANFHRWAAETFLFSEEEEYVRLRHCYIEQMTLRRGTWLVLGLRRYRDTNGVWPRTLDLVSEYVPAEAFSDPTAGEAFVYAPDGDSFRLYSKGFNRVDEGGWCRYVRALDKMEDDIALWPPPVPEPRDKEAIAEELEDIYGRNYRSDKE